MSQSVQPMSAHFFWADGTETHLTNFFEQLDQIPIERGFLIGVFRYLDPVTLEEIQPKKGHWVGGRDNYYFFAGGAGPNFVEYASWDDPTTGQTRTTVYELKGYGVETKREDVRVNTFPNQRKHVGVLVSDEQWNTTSERSWTF